MPTRSSVLVEQGWPDDLRLLLGADGRDLMIDYFAAVDAEVLDIRARQVAYRPGRSSTVRHDVRVRCGDGSEVVESVVTSLGGAIPDGADRMIRDDTDVSVWRWPDDPFLPGLPVALDPRRMTRLFADLGLGRDAVSLRVRAYRPGRRAVIEASNGRVRVFLKVVRPRRAASLHTLHRELAPVLPVPDSIGWTDEGIVVLPGLQGTTLGEVLRSGGVAPDPVEVETLLDRLPADLASGPRRPTWLSAAEHHAEVIAATVPAAADRTAEVLDRLRGAAHLTVVHPTVAIHGDMYEAQLMVAGGRVTGLLDVDTAGAGQRVDDLANFCAHLSVLALIARPSDSVRRYGSRLLARAETNHDRADLRVRVAAAVLGLATGSFRVLEPNWEANTLRRLDLADEWLAGARRSPA